MTSKVHLTKNELPRKEFYMALRRNEKDTDLDFLGKCTDKELMPIVEILLGPKDVDGTRPKHRISAELQRQEEYMKYPDQPSRYVDQIIAEIEAFGGNTIINLFRRHGPPYRVILSDVAEFFKVNFNNRQPIELIERRIFEKVVLDQARFTFLSEHDRERMFSNLSVAKIKGSGAEAITAEGIVAIGNFSVWFSHSWLKSVLMPLSFITNIFAEAYAITVPTVMYISALRRFVKERNM